MKQILIVALTSFVLTVVTGASADDTDSETVTPETGTDLRNSDRDTEAEPKGSDTEGEKAEDTAGEAAAGPVAEAGNGADAETEGSKTETSKNSGGDTAKVTAADSKTTAETATASTEKPGQAKTDAGPPEPGPAVKSRFALQPDPPYTTHSLEVYRHEYEKNRRLQVMGKSMLAASFAMELAGAIVIEAVDWGPVGWSAFGVVGAGIAHFIASAFMLGLSKPPHHLAPPRRDIAREPNSGDIIF